MMSMFFFLSGILWPMSCQKFAMPTKKLLLHHGLSAIDLKGNNLVQMDFSLRCSQGIVWFFFCELKFNCNPWRHSLYTSLSFSPRDDRHVYAEAWGAMDPKMQIHSLFVTKHIHIWFVSVSHPIYTKNMVIKLKPIVLCIELYSNISNIKLCS
ncbi:hypothetical protein XELAEV_18031102mg [Xenopus laevis]|uniref:Secreted protein n=1 Tax=Xenopus laevis TaxID=8355 RepID=A0A974HFR3_XENLA|nr:hypothetical protein XELAEV_18031102mg [Xenopus laevis]